MRVPTPSTQLRVMLVTSRGSNTTVLGVPSLGTAQTWTSEPSLNFSRQAAMCSSSVGRS